MSEPRPLTELDEDELMGLLAEDRDEALAELMTRWQGRLFSFIMRGVRDAGVAEEITQETFWRLWRGRAQYQAGGKFSSWLFRIASRLCLDHYRRQSRSPKLVEASETLQIAAPPADRADRAVRESELNETLNRALTTLPLNQRLALEMVTFEMMSYKEIALALDCSVGAVEQLIFRARRALRVSLADYLPSRGNPLQRKKEKDNL